MAQIVKVSAHGLNRALLETGLCQQHFQGIAGKPEKIVRLLVFMPTLRRRQVKHSTRLQYAEELPDDGRRVGNMLQHLGIDDGAEAVVSKRKLLQLCEQIDLRKIPAGVADAQIAGEIRLLKKPPKSGFSRPSVQHRQGSTFCGFPNQLENRFIQRKDPAPKPVRQPIENGTV